MITKQIQIKLLDLIDQKENVYHNLKSLESSNLVDSVLYHEIFELYRTLDSTCNDLISSLCDSKEV